MDSTITCNADFTPIKLPKGIFKNRCYWERNDLVNQRIHESGAYELVMYRHIDETNKDQLIMTSIYRDLATMQETVATSWFTRSGPPGISAPVADLFVAVSEETDEESEEEVSESVKNYVEKELNISDKKSADIKQISVVDNFSNSTAVLHNNNNNSKTLGNTKSKGLSTNPNTTSVLKTENNTIAFPRVKSVSFGADAIID